MYFDEWQRRAQQRIAQGDAGVGMGGWIKHNAVDLLDAGRMYACDQFAFVVGLKAVKPVAKSVGAITEFSFDIGQCLCAIEVGFAGAEQVQIGADEQQKTSHVMFLYICRRVVCRKIILDTSKTAVLSTIRS